MSMEPQLRDHHKKEPLPLYSPRGEAEADRHSGPCSPQSFQEGNEKDFRTI